MQWNLAAERRTIRASKAHVCAIVVYDRVYGNQCSSARTPGNSGLEVSHHSSRKRVKRPAGPMINICKITPPPPPAFVVASPAPLAVTNGRADGLRVHALRPRQRLLHERAHSADNGIGSIRGTNSSGERFSNLLQIWRIAVQEMQCRDG